MKNRRSDVAATPRFQPDLDDIFSGAPPASVNREHSRFSQWFQQTPPAGNVDDSLEIERNVKKKNDEESNGLLDFLQKPNGRLLEQG